MGVCEPLSCAERPIQIGTSFDASVGPTSRGAGPSLFVRLIGGFEQRMVKKLDSRLLFGCLFVRMCGAEKNCWGHWNIGTTEQRNNGIIGLSIIGFFAVRIFSSVENRENGKADGPLFVSAEHRINVFTNDDRMRVGTEQRMGKLRTRAGILGHLSPR